MSGQPEPGADLLRLNTSRQFVAWMVEQRLSLAFTTYDTGKLFLIGAAAAGRVSVFERSFPRCMALSASSSTLYLSSLAFLWRLENVLDPGVEHEGHDALYVPQAAWVTGDLDVHGIAVDDSDRLILVNTLFSCLAVPSETHSFVPLWQPAFVSRLAAEDRCHLNGVAMVDGRPRVVSALAASDVVEGWRDHRLDGGVLIDVHSGETVAGGLCMPHSPRWHRGELWLLESGTGTLGRVDLASGRFLPVASFPGYPRGLVLHGDFAVVGLSRLRDGDVTRTGLPLAARLQRAGVQPRCGLAVVDLRSGDLVHWLHLEGVVGEVFDVGVMPGVVRPAALGLMSDEIRRTIRIGATPVAP